MKIKKDDYGRLGHAFSRVTESNKPFIRFGVTGPILFGTTEVTWAGLATGNQDIVQKVESNLE